MLALYRNILPKAKYSHYSRSSHKSVYVDNLEDYTSHDEVQIGKFANNGKNRVIIEKIYKITSKIVLVQLAVSILLFFILKYMKFGENILKLRKDLKLSQEQLAEKVDVTRQTILNWS